MLSRMDDPIYSVMVIWMYSFFFFSNIHQSMVNFAIFFCEDGNWDWNDSLLFEDFYFYFVLGLMLRFML